MRAYRNLVYTFLYRYGIDTEHRDDLFQEIFLKVHQSATTYRPSEPLRPWLISIVLNTVRNFRRDHGRRKHFMSRLSLVTGNGPSGTPDSMAVSAPHGPGPEQQMEQQATVTWLERQIASLPDRQREVLVLATLKGLSMKEIARILKLPENTVKTHLRRARLALAERLAVREHAAAAADGGRL